MADLKSPEHPLEVLPAMLNLVLIQTGHLLRDSECRGPKAIGLTKGKVNKYIPLANERFHDALDEIEIKILDAKAVVERDLSAIRKKRASREGANIATTTTSPVDVLTEAVEGDMAQMQAMEVDLPMIDVGAMMGEVQGPVLEDLTQAPLQMTGAEEVTAGDSAELAIAVPLNQDNTAEDTNKDPKATTPKGIDSEVAFTIEHPIQDGDAMDFDFESMFNDPDMTTENGGMGFGDIDFNATTNVNDQNLLALGQPDDLNMANTNPSDVDATSGEDINSLLPGLDAYVTGDAATTNTAAGAAATGLDAYVTGNTASTDTAAAPAAMGPSVAMTLPPAPQPATTTTNTTTQPATAPTVAQFDDLFGGDTFKLGDLEDAHVLGEGQFVDFDFDEEWMKM